MTMFLQRTLYLFILPLVENNVYLYNTHDNLSVELYDCITDTNLPYCRRPFEPISLQRDQTTWYCDHDGISHTFLSLLLKNVSVSTVLHEWSSSIEKANEYARYRKQRQYNEAVDSDEKYLCECLNPQSFGKHCEYLLPMGITFQETITWEIQMRTKNEWEMHRYSDIVCYTTLICNSGLLCLDWRDICDGIQNCMRGYDEENCDKLEFNECEDNEYRCANGMCIPDEYFLDGEYDCADLTDEKEPFGDRECTFAEASYECDDRMCLRSDWSCGDGQCIHNRLDFQFSGFSIQCNSLRDQYHMCETHLYRAQWTLPNGKCYGSFDYKEILEYNRTDIEECLYFVKCALSEGIEKNCPCKNDLSCINELTNPCPSPKIQYPDGAIITPYAFSFYNTGRDWSQRIPDYVAIDGTLKCQGYMIEQHKILEFNYALNLQQLETDFCAFRSNRSILSDGGYDEFCYNDSRTFNNYSYHFVDVCEESKECLSAYRIKDGHRDCAYREDETLSVQSPNTCSQMQRHRFQCSNKEPTCLFADYLGDEIIDCKNARDEWWMKGGIKLSNLICDTQSKDDCGRIRQYIEASWNLDTNNGSNQQFELSKIPFRSFCDSFWNWDSKEDEDIQMCHKWWKCPENQWQCRSGQCIEFVWVLDGEWDCVDASDEQALFVPSNNNFLRDLNIIRNEKLIKDYITLYSNQSFWKICNFSIEYPCFRVNVTDPLNITHNRPCINLNQIGDGHVDCAGGLDERNNLKHCRSSTMLGYYFQCLSAETCVPYYSHCPAKCDDNHVQCFGYNQTSHCSGESDFMCMNGQCEKYSRCDGYFDCSHGEDELFCLNKRGSFFANPDDLYRMRKIDGNIRKKILRLPQIPIDADTNKVTDLPILMLHTDSSTNNFSNEINSYVAYYCNRSIGVQLYNQSIACFCPPQYYGDRCQFHNDRITFLFHLNLSQSIYAESNNPKTILKLLVILLHNNQPLMTESIQTQVLLEEIIVLRKELVYLFYSRSNSSLNDKRSRYFNRSNIINEHPYSIRIEAYELNPSKKARLVGVWLYPIYFDFLPSFRLSKVLHLTKPDTINNSCSNNPCSSHQECQQILNQKSTYVCLCRPNFKGQDCSIKDVMCDQGYCSSDALCRPNYRGLLMGNEQPYCICPLNEIGEQCGLIHDQCHPNPCQNDGKCLSTSSPNRYLCLCDDYHYGDQCQLEKRGVQLNIEKIPSHRAAVVQYFDINYLILDLVLVHQRVYTNLPHQLNYLYNGKIAPAIILVKFYSSTENEIYLISIQIDVESINGSIELNKTNHCVHVQTLFPTKGIKDIEINPITYHHLCIQNLSLLCFVDNSYLCICEENHSRVECFGYDHNLDQCSSCLSGGQCLKENYWKSNFICLCSRCHSGKSCEFSSEYFSFTVDQLFSTNLSSKQSIENQITVILLIFISWLLFLIGLLNNICSFITFRRVKCLRNGIGHYLLWMSITNQINLTFLALRLTHLTLNTTSFRSNSFRDRIFCKILNYLLISSSRIPYCLVSLIAIERVYTTIFLRGRWLKKPRIAKRLLMIMLSFVLITGSYEIYFVQSHIDSNSDRGAVCTLNFPFNQQLWTNIHKIVILIHTFVPFFINICCTTIICYVVIKKKIKINARVVYAHPINTQQLKTTLKKQQSEQIVKESANHVEKKDDEITELPSVKQKHRLLFLRDVLIENKELILGPGITLIPQLFSLPLLITSIAFACQDIETNSIRYLLIISYLTSFIPQLTSFFLYISPSSFYTQEWRLTKLCKWFQSFRRQDPPITTTISCITKDIK